LAGIGAVVAGTSGVLSQTAAKAGSFLQYLTKAGQDPPPVETDPATERQLESAVAELRQALRSAGVDLSEPVKLKPTRNGGLELDRYHLDSPQIDAVLAQQSELAGKIAALLPADGELFIGAAGT
jgi:hypothetical protein